jgi:MFS transporter, DHA1 family, multidrug resistance protein
VVAHLVLFVAFVDNFAMLPTVAPYAEQLGARLTGVGVAVGAYSVTNLVFNVVGGRLVDRVGRRRLVVWSLVLVAVAMLCYPLVSNLAGLIAVRLLHGVGGGILVPAVFTVLADAAPSMERGRAMGRAGAVIGAAAVVAPALAGVVRDAAGFTAVFLTVAGTMGFGAVAAVLLLAEQAPARPPSSSRPSLRELLGRPPLRTACLAAFVFTGAVGSLAAFLPVHVEALGLRPALTGGLFTLFALVALAVMLSRVAGVVDVRGMVTPIVAGLGVYALSLGALGFGPAVLPSAVAVAAFGVGYGLVFPAMTAAVGAAAAPHERGTAFGLFMACFSLGFVVIPPLGGLVAETSALGPFSLAAAGCLVGAVLVGAGRRTAAPTGGLDPRR